MTFAETFTINLLVVGAIRGLMIALIAMGIVLVYRSTRVINFAVGDLGIPAAALLGSMAGTHDWPYWPAFIAVLLVGTLSGAVIELAVVRRLFRAPRVIMLVATIGVAQLAQAVTIALPEYRKGSLQGAYPQPFHGEWDLGHGVVLRSAQVLALIVVPLIALGLWWLLGHTAFGEGVRACVGNPDLARLSGINPKMVSTVVWAISGFLSAMAIILITTEAGASDLVATGPNTLLRGLAAALIGRMVSFPRAVIAAIAIGSSTRCSSSTTPIKPGWCSSCSSWRSSRWWRRDGPPTSVPRASSSRLDTTSCQNGCGASGGCGACRCSSGRSPSPERSRYHSSSRSRRTTCSMPRCCCSRCARCRSRS